MNIHDETTSTSTEVVTERWDAEKGEWVKDTRTVTTEKVTRPARDNSPWQARYAGDHH